MRALVFHSSKHVSVDTVPDPRIEDQRDVILKVTATAICGSDLHIYNGLIPQGKPMTMGHEFMGIVEEAGKGVTHLKRGDRVVVPFPIACGSCFFCEHQLPGHCENSNPKKYGPEGGLLTQKGGALFGYTDLYGGYAGGQAEFVRVPYADVGPRLVPDSLSDEQVLFLSDICPTGYAAIDWADLQGGETVAVFGSGPVGLMAMKAARLRGAKTVIAVDREDYRLQRAQELVGAQTFNYEKVDAIEGIRSLTQGRGADLCVDAVGMEAHRSIGKKISGALHMEVGSIAALESCFSAVRRGGAVSILGVYGAPFDKFPIGQIFDKGLQIYCGQAPVQKTIDKLLKHVEAGELRLDDVISHRMSLADAPKAYQIFCDKQDNCVKVVLKP